MAWMKGYQGGLANDRTCDRAQTMNDAKTLVQSCKDRGSLAAMTVIGQPGVSGDNRR